MASIKIRSIYICHFCTNEFLDRSSLLSHFTHCSSTHRPTNNHNPDEKLRLPRLTKSEHEILQHLKLRRWNSRTHRSKPSEMASRKLLLPFDDSFCSTDTLRSILNESLENETCLTMLNSKSTITSYHHYKYSRRERDNFYASVKRARLKKSHLTMKKSRPTSILIDQGRLIIDLPTQINARQRLNWNQKNSYPLLFDTNFHRLVSLSHEDFFKSYSAEMNRYFHLIHSIASQEFQIIVHSHDDEQTSLPYSAFSFLHLLRQTMMNYAINVQKSAKRDYFQAFSTQSQCNGFDKYQRLDSSSSISDPPTNELNHSEENPTALILLDKQSTSHEVRPCIRLNNCRIDTDTKSSITRSNSTKKSDANPSIHRRLQTRQNSSLSDRNPAINLPSFETKPVIMPSTKIAKEWLTNTVFYRCHACAHEEFFSVLSRECLNLHLSSQHANMEENFKQRLCHYLNNQGRTVKIFQHYLKWQQPWSEKQIEQIFRLSDSHARTNTNVHHRC